jgi:phage terminase large subunit-like protein
MEKDKIIANLIPIPEDNESILFKLKYISEKERKDFLEEIIAKRYPDKGFRGIHYDWQLNARPSQLIIFDESLPWRRFAYVSGRSFGKSRVASEYARYLAETKAGVRIGVIGRTDGDTLGIMIKGNSGILSVCPPWNSPKHYPSYKRVEWNNGSIVEYFSSTEPDKLRGYQFDYAILDELCFAAGTQVYTSKGLKAIEKITTADYLLTRCGFKKVVAHKMTNPFADVFELETASGKKIISTGNHKFFTKNRGFVKLSELNNFDTLKGIEENWIYKYYQQKTQIGLSYMDKFFQEKSYGITKDGIFSEVNLDTDTMQIVWENSYIVSYIRQFLDIYLLTLLYTTLTGVRLTTNYQTWTRCLSRNILVSIVSRSREDSNYYPLGICPEKLGQKIMLIREEKIRLNFCVLYVILLFFQLLEGQTHVQKNVEKLDNEKALKQKLTIVKCVVSYLKQRLEWSNFVQKNVGDREENPSKRKKILVQTVTKNSNNSEQKLKHVLKNVVTNTKNENIIRIRKLHLKIPVYNIEVDGVHEYYANGLLVSNCAWSFPKETFDMISMCLRLGKDPRMLITTTPRNQEFFKEILGDRHTYTYRGSTFENAGNVAKTYLEDMTDRYAGTLLGRQELEAEILTDRKDALFKRETIEKNRVPIKQLNNLPNFIHIVVAVDPAMSVTKRSAETGFCVAAYGEDDHFYILELEGAKLEPIDWAKHTLSLYDNYNVDCIVLETNQGGNLVINNIKQFRPHAPLYSVTATRGKYIRAEPIATLYERGRVHHTKVFSRAEDQLCNFTQAGHDGLVDCVDACVWALSCLMEKSAVGYSSMPAIGGIRSKLINYKLR